jgi:hypothetical protein
MLLPEICFTAQKLSCVSSAGRPRGVFLGWDSLGTHLIAPGVPLQHPKFLGGRSNLPTLKVPSLGIA